MRHISVDSKHLVSEDLRQPLARLSSFVISFSTAFVPVATSSSATTTHPQANLESQLVPDMPHQPGDEHNEKGGAEAPVGNSVERVEIGRMQVVTS